MQENLLSSILIEIVERASTFEERLGNNFIPTRNGLDYSIVSSRLEAWRQASAGGDRDRFLRRLAFDGLDEETAKRALSPARLKDGTPLPDWTGILNDALKAAAIPVDLVEGSENGAKRFLDSAEPLPFEDILAAFVLVARQKLAALTGKAYGLMSCRAHAMLERSLLKSLTFCAAQPLLLEFSILREQALPPAARLLEQLFESDGRSVYRMFVGRMLEGGLVAFLKEYAVLARLLARATSFWVEANAEFLNRLASDLAEIQRVFGGEGELGQVVQVQPALSDKHRGGRSVVGLVFASGLKLVYKPKNMNAEEAFFNLLAWLNEHDAPLPFKILKLISRSTHGWIEYVEHLPCKTMELARRYYTRAGMLLCLVYVLEGTDCHHENIIACGENPVLVDMETLMQHRARPGAESGWADAKALAFGRLRTSVLQTALLPTWLFGKDRRFAYDVSGLGGGGGQDMPYRSMRWICVNTDDMALKSEAFKSRQQANTPVLDGAPLDIKEHSEDIITGFKQMYQFLERRRSALLAPGSPLHTLARLQVRFIYRNTQVYSSILRELLNPNYLRDGADRSIELELLARAQVDQNGIPPYSAASNSGSGAPLFWPLLAAEKQAMEQGDIPFFTACTSSADLEVTPGRVIKDCFSGPSFENAAARLKELGSEDMERQTGFIRAALYTRHTHAATGLRWEEAKGLAGQSPGTDAAGLLSSGELISHAVSIAKELQKLAICAPDGSATWIAPQLILEARRYQLQPAGFNLYDGVCGIVLFLAAVEKVSSGSGFRELALAALKPLRDTLRSPEKSRALAAQLGIGGATGLGSVLYSLTRTGQLLDEVELLEEARQAVCLITAESIERDQSFDIISGAAGAILGLLAVHGAGGGQAALETALACGRHLLSNRTLCGSGHAWATLGGKLLTGFSHGAAGIAYSLLRLHQVTGEAGFRDAAAGAVAYERGFFSPDAGNWADLREGLAGWPAFMTSWCHGAPGIGLARLGGLDALDSGDIRKDIEAALKTTLQSGLQEIDHLCCGNLGRAEILHMAAHRLSRPDLLAAAGALAAQVVARAERAGGYFLSPGLSGVCMPGLFQGTSGVGYALLRMTCPELLPCVLLWE